MSKTHITVTVDGKFVGTTYEYSPKGLRRAISDADLLSKTWTHKKYHVSGIVCSSEEPYKIFPIPEKLQQKINNLK